MDYIYLDELYPNQNVLNGFENLNYNKNIFYGSESLKDTITRMYQTIVKFIQKIWNWIKEQFRKLKSILNFNKRKIEETEEKIKENEEILKNENTNTTTSEYISVEGTKKIHSLINSILKILSSPTPQINVSTYKYIVNTFNNMCKNIDKIIKLSIDQELNNDSTPLYTALLNKHIIGKVESIEQIEDYLNYPQKHYSIPKELVIYSLMNKTKKYNYSENKVKQVLELLPSIKNFKDDQILKNSDCTELLKFCILIVKNLNFESTFDNLEEFSLDFELSNEDVQDLIQNENIDNTVINNVVNKINYLISNYQFIIVFYRALSDYVHILCSHISSIVLIMNQELKNNKN